MSNCSNEEKVDQTTVWKRETDLSRSSIATDMW